MTTLRSKKETAPIVKSWIRNLSPAAEFWLVIALCFGVMLFKSFDDALFHLFVGPRRHPITDFMFLSMGVYELAAMAAVYWIGRIRGWSFASFGLRVTWKGTGAGILLLIAVELALACQSTLLQLSHLSGGYASQFSGALTLPTIAINSLTNPVFEELMEVGYFVHVLKRRGMWPTIAASVLLRTLLHVYAGFAVASGVALLGLIFGLTYWRWRQLWPLIFVHMMFDFFGLLQQNHIR